MTPRLLIAMPLALLIAGCGEAPRAKDSAPQANPVSVATAVAATEEWPALYEATGTVRARASAPVAARMMAYVREVKAQTGDHVREGQVLVTLDARDLDAGSHRAEAAKDEIRAAMPEADSAVAAAQASLTLAQTTDQRMRELYAKKSITDQERDESAARVKAAQAARDMAQARRKQLDAKMAQAEQEARAATVARSYAEVTAPFAGIITAKPVEPGTLATPGAPLFTIEREGGYRLEASVEEAYLTEIHPGQTVSVTLDGIDKTLEARVSEIVPSVDPASRSVTVKIDLPALPGLRSGVFGRAAFALGKRSLLTIPAASLIERGQVQSVMTTEGNVARLRLITTGRRSGDRIEVLSGLEPSTKVIAPVPQGLEDGARIEVRP